MQVKIFFYRDKALQNQQDMVSVVYNYSVLSSKVWIMNSDTIHTENYKFADGAKSQVEVRHKQEKYKIIITKEVDKLPDTQF